MCGEQDILPPNRNWKYRPSERFVFSSKRTLAFQSCLISSDDHRVGGDALKSRSGVCRGRPVKRLLIRRAGVKGLGNNLRRESGAGEGREPCPPPAALSSY